MGNLLVGLVMILPVVTILALSQQDRQRKKHLYMARKWLDRFTLNNPVFELVARGYNTCKELGTPYVVSYWTKPYIVLPNKYLYEVRTADKHHLSFFDNIQDVFFLSNWVLDLFDSHRMVYVVSKGLNARMPECTEIFVKEMNFAFDKVFGDCLEQTGVSAVEALSDITLRIGCSVMVGSDLSRNEAFVSAAQSYYRNNFMTGMIALKLPLGLLRPYLMWPLFKIQQWRYLKTIRIAEPIIRKRMDEKRLGVDDPHRLDAITFELKMLEDFPLSPKSTLSPAQSICADLIQNLWASTSSPGSVIAQMIFQLQATPEYFEPLRDEARVAIREYGWDERFVNHLPLQDSFIRETNRVFATFALSCTRTVMNQPFQFADGLTLYPGDRIGFPAAAVQNDPETFPDACEFNGFRFVELAAQNVRNDHGVNRWAASHSSLTNLIFGYGNHACPGRFLAIRMIKCMFTKLLVEYEFKAEGKEEDFKRLQIEGIGVPNPVRRVFLKKRPLVMGQKRDGC